MPGFKYRAKKSTGDTVEGTIDAQNEDEAVEIMNSRGYFPIKIEKIFLKSDPSSKNLFWNRIKSRDITIFSRQLSSLLKSGVPILRGLSVIFEQSENLKFKAILNQISSDIKEGGSLSSALEKYPSQFSSLYLAMVRAGESNGTLEQALSKIADYRKKQEEIFSRVRMVLIYPVFMAVTGILTIIFMLTFVMPRLIDIFAGLEQNLPLPTKIVLAVSSGFRQWWFWIILGLGAIFFIFKRRTKTKARRLAIDLFKLRLPLLGNFFLKVDLARFCRTLELLVRSGISILKAITIAAQVLENEAIKKEVLLSYEDLEQGASLGNSLRKSKLFPPFMSNLIIVGEESGNLDNSLAEIANFYERDIDEIISTLSVILEPIMILIVGLAVGFIIIAMLLPIFQINLMGGI